MRSQLFSSIGGIILVPIKRARARTAAMAALALLFATLGARAQQSAAAPAPDPTGSISGNVVDGQGSVYEGANVTLTPAGAAASQARHQATDSYGRFRFAALGPGTYTLTVANAGFATQTTIVPLTPGQDLDVAPIKLTPGTVTSVNVTASDSPIAIARAEVQLEEKQRVLGIIPNFYVAYAPNAPPLNASLKFQLAWKTALDPISFLGAGALAGIEQAGNVYSGYGQGAQGYAKRYGAAFANGIIGDMVGNALFPILLHQDPRYFYQGTGTVRSRAMHAIASAVLCKGDNGKWQPNYSGIMGSLAAGGIANLYYPAANRSGAASTFENAGLDVIGGALQGLFQEFVVKKLTPRLPKYGTGH